MPAVVRFDKVSKRYKLGVTRTSLPTVISKWMRQFLRGNIRNSAQGGFHWALNGINFELEKGESLALVGPNGAGKSTILKLLSKITFPTAGSIEVNGQISALIELGAGFHPDLTGRENIYLNGTILGLRRRDIDSRFDEIVSFSELERFIDTPLKRYSSGMAVRLGFSVAACIEPDIFLIDEVLAVGDASFRLKCIDRIKQLHEQGTSLIFVSHDLGLVKAICEAAILLEDGRIRTKGTPAEVIEKYNELLDARRALKLTKGKTYTEHSGHDVEITKIEVLPVGSDLRSGNISSDCPIEIRISYVAYRNIDPASVLIRIYRSDGLSCCVMRTNHDGYNFSLAPGESTISLFMEPLQLSGGRYHAISWIMDADGVSGFARGASEWFQVQSLVPGQQADKGVFEPKRRWMQYRPGAHKASPKSGV
jgi:ABC-type polysaccharide/polyol phosphate transport system ATPase subunit